MDSVDASEEQGQRKTRKQKPRDTCIIVTAAMALLGAAIALRIRRWADFVLVYGAVSPRRCKPLHTSLICGVGSE